MTTPRRPALRYHGGKWRLAPWIIRHFPPHRVYVEPFAGAASVLLRKEPAPVEVLNDRLADVVTFFRVLRDRPADLIRAIELTPYARSAFLEACGPIAADDLERARRFAVVAGQSRSCAGTRSPGGWRYQRAPMPGRTSTFATQWADTAHLWHIAERLRHVQIEDDDALTIIARYDSPATLFYIDPPYLADTRGKARPSGIYIHDYTEADHRRLAEALATIRGMAIVSTYENDLYYQLYPPPWRAVIQAGRTKSHTRRPIETLWISPAAWQKLGQAPALLTPSATPSCVGCRGTGATGTGSAPIGPEVGSIGPDVGSIGPDVGSIGPDVGSIGPDVGSIGPDVGSNEATA
jgi:DNA adenine methylase